MQGRQRSDILASHITNNPTYAHVYMYMQTSIVHSEAVFRGKTPEEIRHPAKIWLMLPLWLHTANTKYLY